MTWTRHGHHIAASPTDDDQGNRPPVARCGGQYLCKKCHEDALVYRAGKRVMSREENTEPDPYETDRPAQYSVPQHHTTAMKLSGRNAEAVAHWTGGEIRYFASDEVKGVAGVVIPTLVAPEFVEVGKYVVQNEKGQFRGVDAELFEKGHQAPNRDIPVQIRSSYLDVEDQIRRRAIENHPAGRNFYRNADGVAIELDTTEDPNSPNGPLNYNSDPYSRSEDRDSGPNGSWPPGYKPNKPRLH